MQIRISIWFNSVNEITYILTISLQDHEIEMVHVQRLKQTTVLFKILKGY